MTRSYTFPTPCDFHVHLREGNMLDLVAPMTAREFGRALIMPNTAKPILTGLDATRYRAEILDVVEEADIHDFDPLMTIKLTKETTPDTILGAGEFVIAAKLYPEGVTTNSDDGVKSVRDLYPVFEEMQRQDMVLCIHGEEPGVFVMDREEAFLNRLGMIATSFPKLRIVLEHVTTAAGVQKVHDLGDNVVATITAHHLFLTLDDVLGSRLHPHHFCMPVAKRPHDRAALLGVALAGDRQFFLGTDSAPHTKDAKQCADGCAGVFTAPVAMPLLLDLFDSQNRLAELSAFTSSNGNRFYGGRPMRKLATYRQEAWKVPSEYPLDGSPMNYPACLVPFRAGATLAWKRKE